MKMVPKVAKTELKTLFYSPIAWFLMIVFLVQCGVVYINYLDSFAGMQELGGQQLEYMTNLTSKIFTDRGAVFSTVMQNLYLYIPLLTMGLISREINGGTIRLLYSSPVKISEIVFGKYLAMMVYSLLLVFIVGVFVTAGMLHIRFADSGMLFSALLGFYLLLCAYSAIGLFMSSLTTYQVVAAVSTFVMIGILSYIGNLWQEIDFVRDLTYFLSIQGRTEQMLNGLITTRDVFYFLIIIYIFLGLSIYKLKAGRESLSAFTKAGRYSVIIVSALAIGYITSRPSLTGYYDATANKSRTLTPKVQKIIKDFGGDKLKVTVYNNLLGNYNYYGLPVARNLFLSIWEPYLRFKPDIEFNYVNYYDSSYDSNISYLYKQYPGKSLKEIAAMTAKNNKMKLSAFLSPAEIHKIADLKPELNRFVMQLTYKGRSTFLRIYDDMSVFPGETEVSAALKRLTTAKLPVVAFLAGDLERSILKSGDREYKTLTNLKTFRYALINQGFDVDTLSLETQDIPAGLSTLVVADSKTEMTANALTKIRQYIDQGGNLLIAGEPGKQLVLSPILQQLNVQLMEGIIAQSSKEFSPDLVLPYMTATTATFTKTVAKRYTDSMPVSMPGATGLAYQDTGSFTIKPLLVTNAKVSWLRKDKMVVDSAAIVYSPANGDQQKSFPTAVSLTRNIQGKEQRIVVTSDADFMSNAELGRYNVRTSNFVFNTALFSWLSYGQFPIDASRPDSKDTRVTVTPEQVDMLNIFFVWVLPGLLLALGAILLIRRKRK